MPFSTICRPSIQIGLLQAIAASHGFDVTAYTLNIDLAKKLGVYLYEKLCNRRKVHFGDWLFSEAAFGAAIDPLGLVARFPDEFRQLLKDLNITQAELTRIRTEVITTYLDELLSSEPWADYKVVGFTCTFEQNVSSFALASRIKTLWPNVVTVFGGSNFEGEMGVELVRSIDCIDFAVSGQGDVAFPRLLKALMVGESPDDIPGVLSKRTSSLNRASRLWYGESPAIEHLPIPDYREYFNRLEAAALLPRTDPLVPEIPYETSRGCWWGQRYHCTFCGLNRDTMKYRSKPAQRVQLDLAQLTKLHKSFNFLVVDNILDTDYFSTLLPALSANRTNYQLFFEVKANLRPDHFRILRAAGVRRIQPGIESLSTRVLELMRKGTTCLQNVNALRWGRYYEISMGWNLLWGFPGESREDYERQLNLMKAITHLQPPGSTARIRIDRFSPLFFDRTEFPNITLMPAGGYENIYPRNVSCDKVAYYFQGEFEGQLPDEAYAHTVEHVKAWRSMWAQRPRPTLEYRYSPEFVHIRDARRGQAPVSYTFEGAAAEVYELCSIVPRTLRAITTELGQRYGDSDVVHCLEDLCNLGLMICEDSTYLTLAIPCGGV